MFLVQTYHLQGAQSASFKTNCQWLAMYNSLIIGILFLKLALCAPWKCYHHHHDHHHNHNLNHHHHHRNTERPYIKEDIIEINIVSS